eukprot:tig00021365_g20825.t1
MSSEKQLQQDAMSTGAGDAQKMQDPSSPLFMPRRDEDVEPGSLAYPFPASEGAGDRSSGLDNERLEQVVRSEVRAAVGDDSAPGGADFERQCSGSDADRERARGLCEPARADFAGGDRGRGGFQGPAGGDRAL